jgi:DNA-binding beta-propeller fold protein YncE
MKRLIAILAFCIPLLALTGSTFASGKTNVYYVYVACESEDEVALVRFDGKEATVAKKIPVGVWPVEIEGPHGLTVSPDGKYWFLSMAHGIPFGHVYKYATGTDELIGRVELGLFPATMQISPATGLLYVVNFNLHGDHVPSSVSIVDPEALEEIDRVETGVMPHGSRVSPDGMKQYSVAMMDDKLYELDALSFEITRTLNVNKNAMAGSRHSGMGHSEMQGKMGRGSKPAKPTWVYPHPKGTHIYIANNGAAEIIEIDVKDWKVTRRFETAPGPYNLEVSADGKYLVASYKTDASTGIWDLEKGKELAKIPNSRKVTHGVTISPDSKYAFVSVEGKGGEPGSVDIIHLEKRKLVAVAEVGKQAGGIAFWKIAEK